MSPCWQRGRNHPQLNLPLSPCWHCGHGDLYLKVGCCGRAHWLLLAILTTSRLLGLSPWLGRAAQVEHGARTLGSMHRLALDLQACHCRRLRAAPPTASKGAIAVSNLSLHHSRRRAALQEWPPGQTQTRAGSPGLAILRSKAPGPLVCGKGPGRGRREPAHRGAARWCSPQTIQAEPRGQVLAGGV